MKTCSSNVTHYSTLPLESQFLYKKQSEFFKQIFNEQFCKKCLQYYLQNKYDVP